MTIPKLEHPAHFGEFSCAACGREVAPLYPRILDKKSNWVCPDCIVYQDDALILAVAMQKRRKGRA